MLTIPKWRVGDWAMSYYNFRNSPSVVSYFTHELFTAEFIPILHEVIDGCTLSFATDYGLDGPGIKFRWGRNFLPIQTGPGAQPASCKMGTESFQGVESGRGVTLTPHPLLVPRSWNRVVLLSLRAFVAYKMVKPTYI
jgi:hypothetical protein